MKELPQTLVGDILRNWEFQSSFFACLMQRASASLGQHRPVAIDCWISPSAIQMQDFLEIDHN
jgi:hypothetical protein